VRIHVTLRFRLLLVLVGVVAAGLLISDVVVYVQLRSYLVAQVDPQLRAGSYQVERVVFSREGLIPPLSLAPPLRSGTSTTLPPKPPTGAHGAFPFAAGRGGSPAGTRNGLFPAGTVGELIGADGRVQGAPVYFFYGARAPAPPVLPRPLPRVGADGEALFTASGTGPGAVTYRVLVRPLHYRGLSVVVAVPLTGVGQTLGRLAVAMALVSLAVLAGLAGLAWWIVRRGLRPLEEMAATAGIIAGGDLGRRVTPAEERTEVGRLGLALNTMLSEIEEAFEARSASEGRLRRFLADASHELRTPLTSIRGYAEIFDLGARERPEDLATAMHRIREEAERMNVLVDDLLLLARLDRERPVHLVPTDLVAVAGTAVAAARAAEPGHPVSIDAPVRAMVSGDAHRLRQVLDNLLANAQRHSPEGEPVEVRVVPGAADVYLEVVDHGPGVPSGDAERIFEPFFRADSSRARSTGGAGLGLAIVAAIVRQHGGAVGVRPAPAGGAAFWIRIPAVGGAPVPTAIRQPGESAGSAEVV